MYVLTSSYFNISSKTICFCTVLYFDSLYTRLQQLGNPAKIYAFDMNAPVSFGMCY